MTRRSLFGLLVSGGAMVIASVIAIPALLFGLSPAMQLRRRETWRPVGLLSDFPLGSVQVGEVTGDLKVWPRSFRRQAVFVSRRSDTELSVFSRSCTDLGCPLAYDPGSTCFFCPCHGGIFTQDGARLAGPPNGPMYRYAHRIRDGVLEIDISSVPSSA
jgi:menaquinol-cytochrome c reductase iron-sulfur subunit